MTLFPTFHRPPILTRTARSLMLATLLALALAAQAEGGELQVEIAGLRNSTGTLRVSLYSEPDSFRKEERAFMRLAQPAKADKAVLIFRDVPPGRYAIMAYHDENDDGKLNLRFGMFPSEGYALSNNPKVIGPPRFSESAFEFSGKEQAPQALTLAY